MKNKVYVVKMKLSDGSYLKKIGCLSINPRGEVIISTPHGIEIGRVPLGSIIVTDIYGEVINCNMEWFHNGDPLIPSQDQTPSP